MSNNELVVLIYFDLEKLANNKGPSEVIAEIESNAKAKKYYIDSYGLELIKLGRGIQGSLYGENYYFKDELNEITINFKEEVANA